MTQNNNQSSSYSKPTVINLVSKNITHLHTCHIATSDSVKQHKLRKRIAWLSNKEGRRNEFISLYIPSTASVDNIIRNLKNKYKFKIIQDEHVNNRVQGVIKNTVQHLKDRKEIPENGLAIFVGIMVEDNQEKEVLVLEEIVPPEPLVTYVFKISNHFHLEPLREMLRNPRIAGFIALDSKEASFGLLNGELFKVVENITSGIAGKSGKGGQSQRRYERERDMELSFFFHRVAGHATEEFLENHKIMALIVGGPGTTKTNFVNGDYLHYELKDALLSIYDTQTAGKEGLNELLKKSSEALKNLCFPEEKVVMQRLLQELHKENGLVSYGLEAVLAAINKGAVEIALVIDDTEFSEIVLTCKVCGLSKKKILKINNKPQTIQEMLSIPCEQCNSKEYTVEKKDVIDVLEDAASKTDAKVEIISTESKEKAQLTLLGGIVALLRYPS
jgi:peptide chain release factor subunit 1